MTGTKHKIYLASLLRAVARFRRFAFSQEPFDADQPFGQDTSAIKHILQGLGIDQTSIQAIINPAGTDAGAILDLADKLTSGSDFGASPAALPRLPLISVFSKIRTGRFPKHSDSTVYFHAQQLSLDSESFFPMSQAKNSPEQYRQLWNDFFSEFNKIAKTKNITYFSENLLKLLEKYTSRVPFLTSDQPVDITLFDHSKTSAAFAVALALYLQSQQKQISFTHNTGAVDIAGQEENSQFLLIGGGMSGIQDFIYDITNTSAAKNLKGRSFYVHILVKTFIMLLLEKLSLTGANIIYSAGGSFYVLAHNSKPVKDHINDFSQLFNKALYLIFDTKLYFPVDFIEFGIKDLSEGRTSEIWHQLISQRIENQKSRKFFPILEQALTVQAVTSNEKDAITGELINNYHYAFFNGQKVKKLTTDLIALGRKLRDTNFLVISRTLQPNLSAKPFNPFNAEYFPKSVAVQEFEQLQLYFYFLKNPPDTLTNAQIIRLNTTDFVLENLTDNVLSFEFYGGNRFPTDDNGDVKEFHQLAQGENLDRLGVLRMDVDNLGQIFLNGFANSSQPSDNQSNFVRLTTLSRSLDLFFSGYINRIWQKNDYSDYTMIIYSGGDDLFIVGRWDKVFEMAFDIRKDFASYTGNNPELSLSAGLVIVGDKYPILKAAKLAGQYEDKAKSHKISFYRQDTKYEVFRDKRYYLEKPFVVEKNSFAFLGQVFNWDIEFDVLYDLYGTLYSYLTDKDEPLPQGFIQTMINLNKLRLKKQNQFGRLEWTWKALYYLKRLKLRNKRLEKFIDATSDTIKKYSSTYGNRRPKLSEFYDDLKLRILREQQYTVPDYINPDTFAVGVVHFMDLMSVALRLAHLKKKTLKN